MITAKLKLQPITPNQHKTVSFRSHKENDEKHPKTIPIANLTLGLPEHRLVKRQGSRYPMNFTVNPCLRR